MCPRTAAAGVKFPPRPRQMRQTVFEAGLWRWARRRMQARPQRRAFLKWTQGEAMTAQEKAFVEDLWNTDPAKASEYWAAGEFLDTEVPTSSALDGGGFDGTMENGKRNRALYGQKKKRSKGIRKKGRNYELEQLTEFHMKAIDVEEQVTIITDDGTKLRLDAIGRTIKENKLILQEYKSSNRARLTSNQKKGFPKY